MPTRKPAWNRLGLNVLREMSISLVNAVKLHPSLASATRMVILAYFRILDWLNKPLFKPIDYRAPNAKQKKYPVTNTFSALPLPIQLFAQDEAHD